MFPQIPGVPLPNESSLSIARAPGFARKPCDSWKTLFHVSQSRHQPRASRASLADLETVGRAVQTSKSRRRMASRMASPPLMKSEMSNRKWRGIKPTRGCPARRNASARSTCSPSSRRNDALYWRRSKHARS